jgi:NTP pyrophosphatase (non-canonical NTP hydrolase)
MKEGVQQLVADFLKDRPVMMTNNTFQVTLDLLLGEVDELKDAHMNGDNKDMAQEVADVFIFAYTLANILGVDVDSEVREKVAYNMSRYTAGDFQDGDYKEDRDKSRAWVHDTLWKDKFYKEIQVSPLESTLG